MTRSRFSNSAGHPVIRIDIADRYDLGAEFFRWEIAVAVAGAVIGIDPFDQPDVEASKIATRKLTDEFEKTGQLPPEKPILEVDGFKFFTDERNAAQLRRLHGRRNAPRLTESPRRGRLFRAPRLHSEEPGAREDLQEMRLDVRDKKRVATCLGFGPRFLHSTGQAYKGGPNTGVFLQITCDDALDLPIPGHKFTFGTVKAAQARGDFDVLAERQRRALRVHLPADRENGLAKLQSAVTEAFESKCKSE